jgi:chromosomal replication initiator protein
MAKRILKDMVKETKRHISIDTIQTQVCDYFGIDSDKVREKTRKQEVVEVRQIAMYLAKNMTKSSLKTIGLQFGGRDHSTVIHAIQSVEERIKSSSKHAKLIKDIQQKIELSAF